jgi:ABC-type sulfate/molybdate transport systems ATPase subunit
MLKVDIKSFSYSDIEILKNISFELEIGEHLAILGESGSGKSTLLHLIYGLLHLEKGAIYWKQKQLKGPTHNLIPGEHFMKLVAQEYNLMPFTTVSENIASHLTKMNDEKDEQRVAELLHVVDLEAFADTLVKNLSGGQKQRVALAKALANKPEVLLLDEPFSNIDTFRKNKIRRELFSYLKEYNITCITATHDSEEALAFADRLLITQNGSLESIGTPEVVFGKIKSEYQTSFFGEVSVLPTHLFNQNSVNATEEPTVKGVDKEIALLPHQLQISREDYGFEVTVKKSYFRGKDYLILSIWQDRDVFFENSEKLLVDTIVKLEKK